VNGDEFESRINQGLCLVEVQKTHYFKWTWSRTWELEDGTIHGPMDEAKTFPHRLSRVFDV